MKNNTFYILSVIIAFCMGALISYLAMYAKQMDILLQAEQKAPAPQATIKTPTHIQNAHSKTSEKNTLGKQHNPTTADIDKSIQAHKSANIHNYTETQAKQLIQNMPDVILEQYINKFMAKDASNLIADKRRFAERAIEELYRPNDNQPLVGTVKIGFNQKPPQNSQDTSNVSKFAKIYAHLDISHAVGNIPTSPYVFVKWINNQTGQVLLFEKKEISASSSQNWVSFVPYDGWQEGSYDVKFYQFTSELQPIAQTTYSIYQVVK